MEIEQLVKLVKCLDSKDDAAEEKYTGQWYILILQRGWVVVGELYKNGHYLSLENASVIRSWGTTNGIGEIAENGPTDKTVLDKCRTVKAHELTLVAMIECNQKKWK